MKRNSQRSLAAYLELVLAKPSLLPVRHDEQRGGWQAIIMEWFFWNLMILELPSGQSQTKIKDSGIFKNKFKMESFMKVAGIKLKMAAILS